MTIARLTKEAIQSQARILKMPGLSRSFEALARKATEERAGYEEFLEASLAAEVQSRHEAAIKNRVAAARFSEVKTLERFDFSKVEGVDPKTIAGLAKCDWIQQGHNVILAGPIGTGKTHLATALGLEACKYLHHVRFWRAADLVQSLIEARDQRELTRLQKRLNTVALLILDELGFVPFDRTGGELLFNILAQRHGKRSVLITTNLSFGEWTKVFGGDEKLTTAILDRLAENATILTPKGKSYRMRKIASTATSAHPPDPTPRSNT